MGKLKLTIFLLVVSIMGLALAGAAQAATEFVSTIKETGGEYSTLASWNASNQCDLTTSRVLSHSGMTGTISDGNYVKGATSGAYGTAIHVTSTQIAIKTITFTFQNAERIDKTPTLGGAPTGTDYVDATSAPDSIISIAKIDSAWTAADTTAVVIDGWTTSATNYIKIYTTDSARHRGVWDTNKYHLELTGWTGIEVKEHNVRIDGLQVRIITTADYQLGITLDYADTGISDFRVSNNIVRGTPANTYGWHYGIVEWDDAAGSVMRIWNNIVYDFNSSVVDAGGINTNSSGVAYTYNNTVYNNYRGIGGDPDSIAINNIAYNNTDNYYNGNGFSASSTNNLSGPSQTDAPGSNPVNAATLNFVNAAGADFHLASGDTAAKNAGVNLTNDANLPFSTDIDGHNRPAAGAWDIGGDQLVGPAVKLAFILQPSPTATAGAAFAQQPKVAVQDASSNTVILDDTTLITLSRGETGANGADNTDTLQGTTLTLSVTDGIADFSGAGLSYNKAETMNILAMDYSHGVLKTADTDFVGTLTNAVVSGAGSAAKVQLTNSFVTKDTWDMMIAPVPGPVFDGSAMIRNGSDNDIYVLQGGNTTGFYKYSISGNSWTALTVVPGAVYYGGTMIRNGSDNDIYVTQGKDLAGFYKYSISGNSWTALTVVPGVVGIGGTMIRNGSDNDIYVTQGGYGQGFYKYSISGNSWTALTVVPETVHSGSAMIRNGADNDIYVMTGRGFTGFYKYSISGNSWTALAAVPGGVSAGSAMLRNGADNDIYVVGGGSSYGFYKYSISGNSWSTLATVPGVVAGGGAMIRNGSDNEIYLIQGSGSGFHKYSISGNSWSTLAAVIGSVGYGSAMVRNGSDNDIYVLQGSNSTGFHKYSISGNAWTGSTISKLASVPDYVGNGSQMLRNGADNDIYVLPGWDSPGFYKYSFSGNAWTALTAVPGGREVDQGSAMIRNGSDNDIYMMPGYPYQDFYKYSISGNSWTALTVVPGIAIDGSQMIRNGSDNEIYVLRGGNMTDFYKYSISGNSWTALTVVPGGVSSGSAMIRNGSDNDIYVLRGGSTASFYKYSISGNSWIELTVVPGLVASGGAMIRNGSDNDIYVLQGGSTASFYKYSISGNSWSTLAAVPDFVYTGSAMIRNSSDNDIYVMQGRDSQGFYKYSISGNSWTTLAAVPGLVGIGSHMIRNGADNEIYVLPGRIFTDLYKYTIGRNEFASSGTFESATIDMAAPANFSTLAWNPTSQPANTSIALEVAANNDNSTWTYTPVANRGSLSGFNGNRYIRYKATLTATDTLVTPSLNDIFISGTDAYTSDTSSNVVVSGLSTVSAATSTVSVSPSSVAAGVNATVTITAKDAYGNPISGIAAGNIVVASTGTNNTIIQPSVATDAIGQTTATISSTKAESKIISVTISGTAITQSASVTVTYAVVSAAASTVTLQYSSIVAGTSTAVNITAKDAYGNPISGIETANIVVASTGSNNTITQPASATSSSGVTYATFSSTKAEEKTISVTINATPINQIQTLTVISYDLDHFTVSGIPSPITAGTPANAVIVTAFDQYNNIKANSGDTITFSSDDGQAIMPADYTFVAGDYGIHTFSVTLKSSGTKYVRVTSAGNLKTGQQSSITVNTSVIDHFTVSGIPSPITAGTPANAVIVAALDQYNNTITNYAGTITFSSDDTQATLPLNYIFVPATDNGAHTFSATLKTSGTKYVSVTGDTKTGQQSGITVNTAASNKLIFTQQPSSPATAGVAFVPNQPKVAVADTFGNTITTDNLTQITLSRGATGTDTLQGATLTLPVTAGVATFSGLSYNMAETMNILATDYSHGLLKTTDADFTGTKTNTVVSGNSVKLLPTTFGSGVDGAITVSSIKNINTDIISGSRTQPDGIAYSVVGLTANTATLSAAPAAGALSAGDKVMLINLQADGTNLANVGNYEFLDVQSVVTDVVTFTGNKANYYGNGASDDTNIGTATTNQRVILQRVPQYTDVTIVASSLNSQQLLATGSGNVDQAAGPEILALANGKYRVYYLYSNGTYGQLAYKETTDTNPPTAANLGSQQLLNIGFSALDQAVGPEILALANGKYRVYYAKDWQYTCVPVGYDTVCYRTYTLCYRETTDTNIPESSNLGAEVSLGVGTSDADIAAHPVIVRMSDNKYRIYYGFYNGTYWQLVYRETTDTNPPEPTNLWAAQGLNTGSSSADQATGPEILALANGKYRIYYQSGSGANWQLAYKETTDTNLPTSSNLGSQQLLYTGSTSTNQAGEPHILALANGKYRVYYNYNNGTYWQLAYKETSGTNPPDSVNGFLTANAWDGTKGGVLAFFANGTVDVQGHIDMTGKGYRNGETAYQGESYNGLGSASSLANLGGGGASPGGGGGGGYGTSGGNFAAAGGNTYGSANLAQLFLGSGGAGWDALNNGAAGGITYLKAGYVTITGDITNSGNAYNALYGGGSGGSVYLSSLSLNLGSGLVTASGGSGIAAGAGGEGRIYLKSDNITGMTSPAATTEALGAITYASSGTFESVAIDMTSAANFTTLSWNPSSQPANTTLDLEVAANNDNATWNYATVANGGSLSGFNGNRYIRYKASLATTDTSATSSLNEIALNYASSGGAAYTSVTSNDVVVNAGPATKLGIITQPSAIATAGVVFDQQPQIAVQDAGGNIKESDNTTLITLTRGSQGTAALQGAALTVQVQNGVATFSGLSYNKVETMNMTATGGGYTQVTTDSVAVSHGPATKLSFTTQPSAIAVAGTTFGQQPIVKVQDAYDNIVESDDTTKITLSRGATGTASLQGTPLTITATDGVATFSGLSYNKAETMNILAQDYSQSSYTSNTDFTGTLTNAAVWGTGSGARVQLTNNFVTVNAWDTQLLAVPGAVSYGSAMLRNSADNDIYVMRGNSSTGFYKYSISGNSWTTLTAVPAAVGNGGALIRNGADNDIYVIPGDYTTGFYKYSISGNSWTTLTAVPAIVYLGGDMIRNAADNDIYVMPGWGTGFYKYSISGNSWTTLTAVPGAVSYGSAMIRNGVDNDIYVLQGNGATGFYKYSISGDSWTTLTAVPAIVYLGGDMIRNAADNDIYVMPGWGTGFYKYSISGNSWTTLTAVPGAVSYGSAMIRNGADNDIYVMRGNSSTGFYKYSISGNSWSTTLAAIPAAVGNGGAMIRNGADNDIYVMPGGSSTGFYKYSISGNSWVGSSVSSLAPVPSAVSYGGVTIRNGTDNDIYVMQGNGATGFYKYSISGNSWTTLTAVPGAVSYGSAMIRNGADNDIYAMRGSGSTNFYKYSISGNSWTTLTAIPGGVGDGSAMIRNGSDNDIYVMQGGGTGFYKYSISGNSWTTLAVVPAVCGQGAAMIRNGSDNDIYAKQGNSNGFYKYSISGNSWTTLTVCPLSSAQGTMLRNGSDNDIYVTQGGGSSGFYKYSISGNSWAGLMSFPGGVWGDSAMIRNGSDNDIYATLGFGTGFYKYSISGNSWTTLTAIPGGVNEGIAMIRAVGENVIYLTQSNNSTGFYKFIIGQDQFVSSGTYESATIDLTAAQQFGNFTWNPTSQPANTTLIIQAAAKNTDSGWVSGDYINLENLTAGKGDIPASLDNNRYVRYKATLTTSDNLVTPSLDDITLNYSSSTGATYSTATSTDVVVSPNAIDHFTVTGIPDPVAAGTVNAAVVVTAYDVHNNVKTDYAGNVTLTSTDGQAVLTPTNYTFVPATDNGAHTFSVTLKTIGTRTVTATGDTKTGEQSVTVNAATPDHAVFTAQPTSSQTAGVDFPDQPVVTLYDIYNNVCTNSSLGVTLSARLASNDTLPGNGTLNGNLSVNAASGVATFTGLSYDRAENIKLMPIASGVTGTSSNTIAVSTNTPTKLVVITQPSATATAGVNFVQQPVFAVQDNYGNTIISDNATQITLARGVTGTAALQGTTLTLPVTAGEAAFSGLSYNKAETMNILATDYAHGILKTTDADFTGTLTSAVVSGTGSAASVILATDVVTPPGSWDTSLASAPASTGYGASLVYSGSGDYIYALRGNSSVTFWRYSVSGNVWDARADILESVGPGGQLIYPGSGDYLYAIPGDTSSLYRYSISGNSWVSLSALPAYAYAGATLAPDGGNYIYYNCGGGAGNRGFWRYSISGNSWETLALSPTITDWGGALIYPGSGDYLYCLRGAQATFWRYSISGNSWVAMTNAPGVTAEGCRLVYPGSGDYLYATQGNGGVDFYRYSISGDSWINMASTPAGFTGGGLTFHGPSGYAYALRGGDPANLYKMFLMAENSSGTFESATIDMGVGATPDYTTLNWNATLPAGVNTTGVVGLWHMNNDWADASGNNNNGTASGATFTTSPKLGSHAGSFSGAGQCAILASQPPVSSTALTVGAWVNTSDATSSNDQTIFNNNQFMLRKGGSLESHFFQLFMKASDNGYSVEPRVQSTTAAVAGTWYHVVATWDGTNERMYINGVLEGTQPRTGTLTSTTIQAQIGKGAQTDPNGNPFSGFIDELFIANRALGQAEITALYNAGAGREIEPMPLKLQLAAKSADSGWVAGDYKGPDNTAGTYFTLSGTTIPASLDNNRYIRYKAYLATADTSVTPSLDDITLNYVVAGGGSAYTSVTTDNVVVDPNSIDHYTITTDPTHNAGVGWTETVTAFDVYNNVATNNSTTQFTMSGTGNVRFYADAASRDSDTGGLASRNYTLASGVATIYVRDNTTETMAITATEGPRSVTTGSITINPATTSRFALNDVASITAGSTPALYTVTRYDPFDNLSTTNTETVDLTSTSAGANKKFSLTDGGAPITTVDITAGNSSAQFYYYDELASLPTFTITASRSGITSGTDDLIVYPNVTTAYSLNSPVDMVAGTTVAQYTVTRRDAYNNLRTQDAETVTLDSTSAGANKKFSATSNGPSIATIDIPDASSSNDFFYYDELMGAYDITVSRSGVTSATDSINVSHAASDHLRFSANIATPQKAGVGFNLPVIQAVDAFGNILNNQFGAPTYTGVKTLTYTLSGAVNAPNASATDAWTTAVNFLNGVSTTTLDTALYRAQTTTITASSKLAQGGDLPDAPITPDVASSAVVVNPEAIDHLDFDTQQPSADATINVPFIQQPIVTIRDVYGNPSQDLTGDGTPDSVNIQLLDSSINTGNPSDATGTLNATQNPVAASLGLAAFDAVRYSDLGTIYLYAFSPGNPAITEAYSTAVAFSVAASTTVEVSAAPVADFNLIPTDDTEAEKFAALKFRVQDAGADLTPTLIDRIVIPIGGTGANASTDIAWAELRDESVALDIATGADITNNLITFGIAPDSDSSAGLVSVTDGASKEFTVNIYMKSSKLVAIEGQTYTFDVDESNVSADAGLSSLIVPDSGKVSPVTGTISVAMTHLEAVTSTDASSVSMNAGASVGIKIQATDANKNIDNGYAGFHNMVFSGLGSIGSNYPKVGPVYATATRFNNVRSMNFAGGVVADTLWAVKKETGLVVAAEQGQSYQNHGLSVDVAALAAASIAVATGNNQTGAINAVVGQPIAAFIGDTYGNPVGGTSVTFAITGTPGGATGQSVTSPIASDNTTGLAGANLTFGNIAGVYTVQASSVGLTGSPVTFTATAVAPASMNIVSGNNPSGKRVTEACAPFVVSVLGPGGEPIPGVTVNFAFNSVPSGTSGEGLSAASAATNSSGQAQTILTLGNKRGVYNVRASFSSFWADFTVNALPQLPNKVVFTGSSSVKAGDLSTAFTISIQDQYDNLSEVTQDTVFTLSNNPATQGTFYLVYPGTPVAGNLITVANATSGINFYYRDIQTSTVSGLASLVVNRQSGDTLATAIASMPFTIIPADIDHFGVSAVDGSAMDAGATRTITITAYDTQNNIKTDYSGDISMTFTDSTVNPSPSPSAQQPTINGTPLGSGVILNFSSGAVTADIRLYKAETAVIKARAGSVVTPDPSAISLTVRNLAPDHLKFAGNLPSGRTAGVAFNFDTTIDAVDIYDNICDGAFGAPVYNDAGRTVTYDLSGVENGPEGAADTFVTNVAFASGRSTTPLSATLYRAQNTAITPSVTNLLGVNVASNSVTVNEDIIDHLRFVQTPSATCITTQALAPQPTVAVADQWGNSVKTASANITLRASLTSGSYTAPNGALTSPTGIIKTLTQGEAAFTGVRYDYPEAIYLEAVVSAYGLTPIYAPIAFSTANEASVVAVAQPDAISSLATTAAAKVPVLGFTISDAGTDGAPTSIRQIIIKNPVVAPGATADWTQFITSAYLVSAGSSDLQASNITGNRIYFGSGSSTIYSVTEATSKTFILNLVLKSPAGSNPSLPVGADNETMQFSFDVLDGDLVLDTITSGVNPASVAVVDSGVIDVDATDFKLLDTPVSISAGGTATLNLNAVDVNFNIDENYAGDRSLVFSGALASPKGNVPTVTSGLTVNFADTYGAITPTIIVPFTAGVNTAQVVLALYNAEIAAIRAYEQNGPYGAAIGTPLANARAIVVNGGTADELFWDTDPITPTVANAPWKPFVISVTDAYGNTASSSITDVTIGLTGGNLGTGCVSTVATSNGKATFNNFTVTAANYPAGVYITGTAPGISTPTTQFGPIVVAANYNVRVTVKDSVSSSDLPQVAMQVLEGANVVQTFTTSNPPFDFTLPYGVYTVSLDKEKYVQFNGEKTAGVTDDYSTDGIYDNNINWIIYMTSLEEATADYQVKSTFVYDDVSDQLTSRLWLERRGKLVTNSSGSINKLGSATVQIYDDTSGTWLNTLTIPAPATNDYNTGVYRLDILNVTQAGGQIVLTRGRTYYARCIINYGGLLGNGYGYETGTTFTITLAQSLAAVTNQISGVTGQIATMSTDIQAQVAGVKTTVASEVGAATQTLGTQIGTVKTETQKILTATETTLPEQLKTVQTQMTTAAKSEILNRENVVLAGSTIVIRYRTYENASPIISVYDPLNVARVSSMPMAQGSPGIYEYAVTFGSTWPIGDYSIVCSETSYGTMDAITITVKTADVESIASDVSAVLGSVTPVRDIKSKIDAFTAAFNVIEENISRAAETLATVKAGSAEAAEAADQMTSLYANLKEMSAKIHELGATVGYDMEKLYEVSEAKSRDIDYIRNKTQELKALLLLSQQMIEGAAKEEPVVQTWFEFR